MLNDTKVGDLWGESSRVRNARERDRFEVVLVKESGSELLNWIIFNVDAPREGHHIG